MPSRHNLARKKRRAKEAVKRVKSAQNMRKNKAKRLAKEEATK
ncbi:MAG: hypothetical protein ABH846_04065 [Patescibacteria group bacterium]